MSSKVEVIFNGVSSESPDLGILQVRKIGRDIAPSTNDNFLNIMGMDGVYDQGFTRQPRNIPVELIMGGDTLEEVRQFARKLAEWSDIPFPAPLIFTDEPDKVYLARMTGTFSADQIYTTKICTLNFLVPGVYAKSITPVEVYARNSPVSIVNPGTARKNTPLEIYAIVHSAAPSFQINLLSTGEKIVINKALKTGDDIYINTATRKALLNGVNVRSDVTISSDYFKLPRGQHSLTYSPSDSEIEIIFNPLWL